MPENPFSDDELKRRAQVGMLRSDAPVANTMPIGGASSVIPEQPTAPGAGAAKNGMKDFMHGFAADNYDNPSMQSVKYKFARLASDYGANSPSKMAALAKSPEFMSAFPGATFDGKDMMNFNGALSDGDHGSPVGMIDVLEAADAGNDSANGVWWGWDTGGGAQGAPAQGGAPAAKVGGGYNPLMDNSSLAKILAELDATSKNEQSPAEREAILQALQGQAI